MDPAVGQLINLALAERAISVDDARKLRAHADKQGSDLEAVSAVMVRFHGVPPELAQALRERVIGTQPASTAPAVLVILPAASADPVPGQADAVARAFGLTVPEARDELSEPLPRVAMRGAADSLLPLVDALSAAGVQAVAFEQTAIVPTGRPFVAERLRVTGATLHVHGPRGEERVDLARPVLLVAGLRGAPPASEGFESKETLLFGHLYAAGADDPLELTERDITDWRILGTDAGPDARENLRRVLERIRAHRGVTWNDSLVRHAGRVKDCTVGLADVDGADVLSRVLHHTWRAERGSRRSAPAAFTPAAADAGAAPRRLPPRPADGMASCGTCGVRRIVNDFGRCSMCGNDITLPTERPGWTLGAIAKGVAIRIAMTIMAIAMTIVGRLVRRAADDETADAIVLGSFVGVCVGLFMYVARRRR